MPIRFRCSFCQKPLSIGRRKAGTAIHCAQCAGPLTVPAVSDGALDALARRRRNGEREPEAAPPTPAPLTSAPPAFAPAPTVPEESAPLPVPPLPIAPVSPKMPSLVFSESELRELAEPDAGGQGPRRRRAALLAVFGVALLVAAGLVLALVSGRRQEVLLLLVSTSAPQDPLLLLQQGDPAKSGKATGNDNKLMTEALAELAKKKKLLPTPEPATKEKPPAVVISRPPVVEPKLPVRPPVETEDELYRRALKTAKQALADGDYEQAVTWFRIAGGIRNSGKVIDGLLQAEKGRLEAVALAATRKVQRERAQKLARYGQWMLHGQSARSLRQFDSAFAAFTKAQNLFPDDVRAAEALVQTALERDRWVAAEKRKAELKQLVNDRALQAKAEREGAEYRKAREAGWSALREGKYSYALASFLAARALRPQDEDAREGWEIARRGRIRQQLHEQELEDQQRRREREALAQEENAKREKAYRQFLADGQDALGRRRHDEAIWLFIQALEMRPDDAEARRLWREAQQGRDRLHAQREQQDKDRAAEQVLRAAAAAKKVAQFEQELATLKTVAETQRRAADLRQFLIASEVAIASGKYDDAVRMLDQARTLQADTPWTIALREQAGKRKQRRVVALQTIKELSAAQAQARDEVERRKLKERQAVLAAQTEKQAQEQQATSYQRFLKEGKQAFEQRGFDAAIDQLTAALRVRPDDPTALGLLDQSRRQRDDHLKAVAAANAKRAQELAAATEESRRRKQEADRLAAEAQARQQAERKTRDFEQFLVNGRLALGKGQVEDALTSLTAAGKMRPGDRGLAELIEQAKQQKEKLRAARDEEAKRVAREQVRRQERLRLAREEQERAEKKRQAVAAEKRLATDFQNALRHGHDALAQGKPLLAVAAFNRALALQPGNEEATTGLRTAQQANERVLADARQKAEQQEQERQRQREQEKAKQRERDYEQFLTYGRDALAKGRLESAVSAFTEAQKRVPDDARATAGLNKARELMAVRAKVEAAQAEKWRQQRQAAEAAQQKALDEARAKVAAQRPKAPPTDPLPPLLATCRAAIELRRLEAADTALSAAKKIAPDDDRVARLARDLELARKIVQADRATAEKLALQQSLQESLEAFPLAASERQAVRKAKVDLHLTAARSHMQAGRRVDAAREFEAVLRLAPDHPEAVPGLRKAREGAE